MKIRDEKTKRAFQKYLEEHPDERFWQAIRNFWRADYVVLVSDLEDLSTAEGKDTFYIEADEVKKYEE